MQLAHDSLRLAVFKADVGPNSALIVLSGLGAEGPLRSVVVIAEHPANND